MSSRRLVIMRHAKSSWEPGVDTDHERPLNKRGRRDAPRVAARLLSLGWSPEVIISSDSMRTRETCELMIEKLEQTETHFTEHLYLAGLDEIREQVCMVPPDMKRVLVLGHNPGWENAVDVLTGQPTTMKTACAALLEGTGETWADALADDASWNLVTVVRPRELVE